MFLFLSSIASGQNWEFLFDSNGNLRTEVTAVSAPPQILGQPQTRVVAPGQHASFSVLAADTRGLTYQWLFNGSIVPGATADALLLTNVSAANEGLYSVVLVNSSGSVTSAPAALFIDTDDDEIADSWERTYFGNLNQNALGDFDHDGTSNLDEFRSGSNPTNAASALFTLTVLSDGGSVLVAPNLPTYTNGQVVTVTVSENYGDHFQGWTGAAVGTNNPLTLVMNTNKTVFAHFRQYTISWTNTISGSWHAPTNWSPNLVPDADDDVIISNFVTVTVTADAHCHDFVLGTGGQNPTLNGSGTLTIHGSWVWATGVMSGNGRTTIAPEATLTVASLLNRPLNTRTLENRGTMMLTGAGGIVLNNAVITNGAGALFQAQSAATLSSAGGANRLDNAGVFRKSAGGTTSVFGASFNNYGAVELLGGSLDLASGGAHLGSFDVAAGRTLIFSGGTHSAGAASTITGDGNLTVSGNGATTLGGLVNLHGTYTLGGLVVNLTGNFICTNNTLAIPSGAANFNGTGVVTPSTLTLNGTLSGSNAVTVLNQMTWSAGVMSGTGRTLIPSGVTLTLNNLGSVALNGRTLDNAGTVLWTGAGSLVMSSAVITNRPGALFQAQSAAPLSSGGAPNRFDNAGRFRKSAGGTTSMVGVNFNNSGGVELVGGNLDLGGGGTHVGSFEVMTGRTLIFSGGIHSAAAISTITGEGNLTVSGSGTTALAGLVNVQGTHTLGGLTVNVTGNYICTNNTLAIPSGVANLNGTGVVTPALFTLNGILSGSNTVTVLNQGTWSGGLMSGRGQTMIAPTATLTINNPGSVTLNTRTLENGGTVLWPGAGSIILNSGIITNRPGALFQAQSAASLANGGGVNRFDNAGTFRKTASATTLINNNVPFNNFGTIEIRRGILQANGGFTSRNSALLNCAIGGTTAGSGFGQLQIAGTANLSGALTVDLINGFVPAMNDSFAVLTAGTRTGAFANFLYPSNIVTMQLSNTATSVVLFVTGLPDPAPRFLPPELLGTDIRLVWTAVSNRTYRLEINPDLNPTNWSPLPGDVISVSNTASKLDALTSTNRFYRIRVVP